MSKYEAIKAATNAYIKTNGRQEITGAILNAVMIATIDSLGRFYQFVGSASPDTDPGTIDQNIAYLASTPGTYTKLGGLSVDAGEIAVLKFDGQWKKEVIVVIPAKVSQLENDLGFITNAVSDLVNYYTKTETDTALSNFFTKPEVNAILSGYYDKDEVDSIVSALTRQSYVVAWDGTAEPVVGDIPAGVSVSWGGNTYVGTLPASASTIGRIYLVSNGAGYDEYITTEDGGYSWISIGTTSIDLSDYVTQAQFSQLEAEVDDLEDGLVLSDTIRKETTDASYISSANISGTSIVTSSGRRLYYLPVKAGQSVTAKYTITSGYVTVGFDSSVPQIGHTVSNSKAKNTSTHENGFTAPSDGYFCCAVVTAGVTELHFELSNLGFGKAVNDAIAVVSGGVSLLNSAVNPAVKYIDISTRCQRIKGFANADGQWKQIGTAGQYFLYVPVESGKTYRLAGTYVISAAIYADILFSDVMPVTDAYGVVLDAEKADGTTFDVTFTAPSDGFVFIWVKNSTTYYDSFFLVSQVSRFDGLDKNDADIKEAISYEDENEAITDFTSIKGYVISSGAFTKIGDDESAITMRYFPVTAGVSYRIQGVHASLSDYGSITFSESVPVSGDFGIIVKASVANASFDVTYAPDLDGYLFIYASSFQVTKKVPEKKMITKDLIFSGQFSEQIKLVGVAYQQKLVVVSSHKVADTTSNGSFIISVLEGEKYFIRSHTKALSSYALVAFSDSIADQYSSGCVVLKSVSENDDNYEYSYTFTAPKNGYLLVWCTSSVYGNRNYVDIFRLKERQTEIFDRYLPDAVKMQTFGDSITDNNWGDYSSWVSYVPDNIKNTNLTIINSAVGGASIGGSGSYNIPNQVMNGYTRDDGSVAEPLDNTADIVVIFAGTNDYAGGQTIASTTGNLATTLQYIFEHSKAKVLFCTPLQRYNTTDQSFDTDDNGVPVNANGMTLRQVCDELVKVCHRFSVPVLDLNAEANINRYNILDYSSDGLHPQRWGDAYVSRLICEKIKAMLRYDLQ